jgi:diacylglycerol O-acyltransferase
VAGDDDGTDSGHHVSAVVSSLATDTRDPSLRIQVIQDATREARRRRAIGAQQLRQWEHFAAPAVLGKAGRIAARTLRDAPTPPSNLIVANIPGPTQPLYTAGAIVRDLFFFGPIAQGVPLAVSVVSIGDRLDMALLGCPDTAPPVGELVGHFEAALDELIATVPEQRRPSGSVVASPAVAGLGRRRLGPGVS